MDHDALGEKNVNGAIFLDAAVTLKSRPYSLVLYGHNMKTGAMFGNLRNYENASFYHKNPFISFDSMYEKGRYVIFAVTNISIEKGQPLYGFLFLSVHPFSEASGDDQFLTVHVGSYLYR